MSNNLQEINNLKEELRRLSPSRIIQTGHNLYEQHDKNTIKKLCVTCGGKGFYLLIQGFPTKAVIPGRTGEIIPCEECEDGFKYSEMLEEYHGKGV